MKNLVLIGGGGHCKSVLDSALRMSAFNNIVVTDFDSAPGTIILGNISIAGSDDILSDLRNEGYNYAFITVGSIKSSALREKLVKKAISFGFGFPSIIDPSASISRFSKIQDGTFIGKNAIVNANVSLGKHCIINSGAIIEHDCNVGDFSHVSVGSILCGNVTVGARSFVGAGSTIVQGKTIGSNVIIGANSTVLSDIPDNNTVYGLIK